MVKNSKNIFISFKNTDPNDASKETKDTEFARILSETLIKENFVVFFFKHHQTPGASIDSKLQKKIDDSFYFIWISTSPAHQSDIVLKEISAFEKNRAKDSKLLFIPFLEKKFTVDQYSSSNGSLDSIKDLEVVSFDDTTYQKKDFYLKLNVVVETIKKHDAKINPKKVFTEKFKSKQKSTTSQPKEITPDQELRIKAYEEDEEEIKKFDDKLTNKEKITERQYLYITELILIQINKLGHLLKEIPHLTQVYTHLYEGKQLVRILTNFKKALKDLQLSKVVSFEGFSFFSLKKAYLNAKKRILNKYPKLNDEADGVFKKENLVFVCGEHKDPNRRISKTNYIVELNGEPLIKFKLLDNRFLFKKVVIEIQNEFFR
jgi:hypothetical protein